MRLKAAGRGSDGKATHRHPCMGMPPAASSPKPGTGPLSPRCYCWRRPRLMKAQTDIYQPREPSLA